MKKITLLTFTLIASCCLVIGYAQPGQLDPSFGNDGVVEADFALNGFKSIVVQEDGKIVVAGSFAVARYDTDGKLDKTFSVNGYETVDYEITAIAIQSDGKIVIAGTVIARYNTDGSPDNTFSGDGRQTANFNITSMAIQTDNKIVVAGDSLIARLTALGDLDITFSKDGIQKTNFGIASVAIQNNGKIIVAGSLTGEYNPDDFYEENNFDFAVARFNADGSLDKGFGSGGVTITDFYYDAEYVRYHADDVATSIAIQTDGKIVVAGRSVGVDEGDVAVSHFAFARYNIDGSSDIKQRAVPGLNGQIFASTPIVVQSNGKIVLAGSAAAFDTDQQAREVSVLARFNADGRLDSTFGKDGVQITPNAIFGTGIASNALYAVGDRQDAGKPGIVEKYLLNDEIKAPTVSLSIPYNIVKYTAPARIKLNATAIDKDGKITKVQFFNGTTRIHTETVAPYGFLWINVPAGNYTLTAKAFDNNGNVTTSNSIKVSVTDENVPPVVSIVSPANNTTYTGSATIRLIADAKDPNDKIIKVEFYSKTILIRTERYYPYRYTWTNVQSGTYTVTAKAYNSKGVSTKSAPVTIRVKASSLPIVKSKPSINNQTDVNGALSLRLSPVPAQNTLNIYTKGLQLNKPATISVISASGVLMKTIQSNASNKVVQLDVSSMVSGVYTIRVVSGDKVMYKKFVKL